MQERIKQEEFNLDALPSDTTIRFYIITLISLLTVYYLGYWYNLILIHTSIVALYAGFIMIGVLIILSGLIYLLMPRLLIRSNRLVLADSTNDQDLIARVNGLADRLKVSHPAIYLSTNIRRQNAQVFGSQKKAKLRIDRGLVLLLKRRPDIFDAVVLHELSHILHRDVFYAYAAKAFVLATVFLTVPLVTKRGYLFFYALLDLPFEWIGNVSWMTSALWILDNIWRFLENVAIFIPLFMIMFIEYARLIRVREHYADWRAAQHGANDTLIAIFSEKQKKSISTWRRFFAKHPTVFERAEFLRASLTEGSRISIEDIFIIGLLSAVILNASINLANDFKSLIADNLKPDRIQDFSNFANMANSEFFGAWAPVAVTFLAANGLLAICLSTLISRYCLGSYLKGIPIGQLLAGSFPAMVAGFIGAALGECASPTTLFDVSENWLSEVFRHATYMFCLVTVNVMYFAIIVRTTVSWTQGMCPPRWGLIAVCVAGYLLSNIATLFTAIIFGVKNQNFFGGLDVEDVRFVMMVSAIVYFVLFVGISICLTWLLTWGRRRSAKFYAVPSWLCVLIKSA